MGIFKKLFYFVTLFYSVNLYGLTVKLELYDVQKPGPNDRDIDAIAYIGEQFDIKVELSTVDNNTQSLQVDGLDNFQAMGQNQSKTYSSINGNTSVNLIQEYFVYPDHEGIFTIGPARVMHDGKEILSNSFKIRALKKPETSSANQQSGSGQKSGREDFFCKLVTQKKSVFINEPVEVDLLIYFRGPVHDFGFAEQPKFQGFTIKEVVQMSERQETIDGKPYIVKDKKFILFPTKQGVHTIEPIHFAYNIVVERKQRFSGSGFEHMIQAMLGGQQLEQRRAVSNSLNITVKPLPETKKNIDAVGNFTKFTGIVDKHDLVANEPLLFTLEIEGKTDFDRLAAPKLRLPKDMKYYASKTDIQEDFSERYIDGKKKFEFVIQIAKPGSWEIPAQELRYFDTVSQTYKVLTTTPILLNVSSAPDEQVSDNQKNKNEEEHEQEKTEEPENKQIFSQDINFIEEDTKAVHKSRAMGLPLILFLFFVLVPVIASRFAFVQASVYRIITRLRFGPSKTQQVFIMTQHQLTELEKLGNAKPLYNILVGFLALRFNVAQDVVTEHWLETRLAQEGWTHEKISEFITYLHDCAGVYFSSLGMSEAQQRDLLRRASYWLLMLNK